MLPVVQSKQTINSEWPKPLGQGKKHSWGIQTYMYVCILIGFQTHGNKPLGHQIANGCRFYAF